MINHSRKALDLRFNGKLAPEISLLFNKVANECRKSFNELVSDLSLPHNKNLDWWVQGPASRNTFVSPLFHYYCCLCLINHLITEGKFNFDKVVVCSPKFRELIEKLINDRKIKHCVVQCSNGFVLTAKQAIKKYLSSPVLFFKKLIQFAIARLTRNPSLNLKPEKPIVLIDTFITPDYITPERWYGDLWELLTEEMRVETFFVPTIVGAPLKSMFSIYNRLRLESGKYLIKEDYLNLSDLVYAFRHKKRIKEMSIKPVSVLGYDISGIVKEGLETNSDFLTVVESILTYRFIMRLSESGAKVRLAIDWFEGQAIDKAWNLAFKDYFPDSSRIGYRAFESYPYYLCSYPIPVEREAGVIPDSIAVQGKGTKLTVREFLPDLDVIVIPSLRASHVWEYNQNKYVQENMLVLVALPISVMSSVRIIRRLIDVHKVMELKGRVVRYVLKPHPTVSVNTLTGSLKRIVPDDFLFSREKSFAKMLAEADLLITEASSSCLEALACGIPVIIMENDEGLTYDPIPDGIPMELYCRANTQEQLINGIKSFAGLTPEDLERQKTMASKIKEDYFEPITKEGIGRLMGFSNEKV